MSKFKVGDRVRIVEDGGFYLRNIDKKGEIKSIKENEVYPIFVTFDDGGEDCGRETDVELIELESEPKPQKSKPEIFFMDNDKLKIVFAPPYTILEWKCLNEKYKARATCNPEDTFDKFEGFRLAMHRLKSKLSKNGWNPRF